MTREWHRVEFLARGERKRDAEGKDQEYHPQGSLGHGYYVIEDGAVVAHVDEKGRALEMDRVHECRVVAVLKSSPFPAKTGKQGRGMSAPESA